MKIGIITFHRSHNSGSILQAFALQTFIKENLGYDNEIVDFSNVGQKRQYAVLIKPYRLKDVLRDILYGMFFIPMNRHRKDYDKFIENTLILSSKRYETSKEIEEDNLEITYDALICGSDQVWNTKCKDSDPAYFLDFAKQTKKIAYATSMGAVSITEQGKEKVEYYRDLLNQFNAISVREISAKSWIGELVDKKISITADPTLLLAREYFERLCLPRLIKNDYIFYYSFGYNHSISRIVKEVSKKTGLQVIVMNAEHWVRRHLFTYGFKLYKHGGPDVFLTLMRDAKLVITTSLHGSIFASKYEKCFWYIKGADHNPKDDRAVSLLTQLGLLDRFVDRDELMRQDLFKDIDYTSTKLLTQELIADSNDFLKDNIGNNFKCGVL